MLAQAITFGALSGGLWLSMYLLEQPVLVFLCGIAIGFLTPILAAKFAKSEEPSPYVARPHMHSEAYYYFRAQALRNAREGQDTVGDSSVFLYGFGVFLLICGIPALWIGLNEFEKFLSQPWLAASFLYVPGACFGAALSCFFFARREAKKKDAAKEHLDG